MRAIKTTTISILAVGLLAGSGVGVAAQDEETDASAPGYVLFTDGFDLDLEGPTAVSEVTATDPRASGRLSVAMDNDAVENGEDSVGLAVYSVSLTNDGGSWTGTGDGITSGLENRSLMLLSLDGRDGYDGLSLYVVAEDAGEEDANYDPIIETWGVIAPSDLKPAEYPSLPAE